MMQDPTRPIPARVGAQHAATGVSANVNVGAMSTGVATELAMKHPS
jgi:hypothetical protein